jgi:hypothetical protein
MVMGQAEGFKNRFYSELQKDYNDHFTESFLYRYMEAEKRDNLRLKLKQHSIDVELGKEGETELLLFLLEELPGYEKLSELWQRLSQGSRECLLGQADSMTRAELRSCFTKRREELRLQGQEAGSGSGKKGKKAAKDSEAVKALTEDLLRCMECKDIYVQLWECSMDYENGNIDDTAYFTFLLTFLRENGKYSVGEKLREQILEYGRKLCEEAAPGEALYRGKRSYADKYGALIQLLEKHPLETAEVQPDFDFRAIAEKLTEGIIQQAVQTFLYDVGYPVNELTDSTVAKARKKDRTMDMLDSYCRQKQILFLPKRKVDTSILVDTDFLSEEKKRDAEGLMEILKKENNSKVFVPIAIDGETGAGIYIVGRDYIIGYEDHKNEFLRQKRELTACCCYCILFYEDFMLDLQGDFVTGSRMKQEMVSAAVSFTIDNFPEFFNFPSIVDAEECFKSCKAEGTFHNAYIGSSEEGLNGQPPKGCPERFLQYFETEEEELDLEAIRRELELEEAQFGGKEKQDRDRKKRMDALLKWK